MDNDVWLLEEDVLLLVIECGLLSGMEWSKTDIAIDAQDLDSVRRRHLGHYGKKGGTLS